MDGMYAQASIVETRNAEQALHRVISETGALWTKQDIDLALVFAHTQFETEFEYILHGIREVVGARIILGCSGQGIIGKTREVEAVPALSMLILSLPGAQLRAVHMTQRQLAQTQTPAAWHAFTGAPPDTVNAWLVFMDPFHLDGEAFIAGLSAAYPGIPIIGGLASPPPQVQRTSIFLNERVHHEGAVAVAIGGAVTVHTVVAQGATPIGEPWTVTDVQDNIIRTISQRPAYELLVDTVKALPPDLSSRVQRNLLIGLAANEYKDVFGRGDFVIRTVLGADPRNGALAVGAMPRVGQTIQFQLRDARSADQDLNELLEAAKRELGDRAPIAALLCACNGRGSALFGEPDHDARTVSEKLGGIPLAGLFCSGEIGPVGNRNFLQGYTATIALFVPVASPQPASASAREATG